MAKTTYKTWADHAVPTAAEFNEQIRDNGNALWVGTTEGDMDYYNSATTKARLAIGANGTVLQSNGTVPFWADAEGFRVYKSTAQACAAATLTLVSSFDTETFDTDAFHTGTSGSPTIPANFGGLYLLGCYGAFAAQATADRLRHIELLVNNVIIAAQDVANGGNDTMNLCLETIYVLAAGDVITMKAQQNSGSSVNLNSATIWGARIK